MCYPFKVKHLYQPAQQATLVPYSQSAVFMRNQHGAFHILSRVGQNVEQPNGGRTIPQSMKCGPIVSFSRNFPEMCNS